MGGEATVAESDLEWDTSKFKVFMEQEEFDRVSQLAVYKRAEEYARGAVPGYTISHAVGLIESNVSGHTRESMRKILDWYVSQTAEAYAQGKVQGYTVAHAKQLIVNHASTPERRDAMLRQLGMM